MPLGHADRLFVELASFLNLSRPGCNLRSRGDRVKLPGVASGLLQVAGRAIGVTGEEGQLLKHKSYGNRIDLERDSALGRFTRFVEAAKPRYASARFEYGKPCAGFRLIACCPSSDARSKSPR